MYVIDMKIKIENNKREKLRFILYDEKSQIKF